MKNEGSTKVWLLLGLLVVVIILAVFVSYFNNSSETQPVPKTITQTKNENKASPTPTTIPTPKPQYNYSPPAALTPNYPKELLVEQQANLSIVQTVADHAVVTSYDSQNGPAKVLDIYKTSLTKNGWTVAAQAGAASVLQATKESASVEIKADAGADGNAAGSKVTVTLKNK